MSIYFMSIFREHPFREHSFHMFHVNQAASTARTPVPPAPAVDLTSLDEPVHDEPNPKKVLLHPTSIS